MPRRNLTRKSKFISVEISIKTDSDAEAFVKWFEAQDNYVAKLPCDSHKWYIYFAPIPWKDADTTIRNLCAVIRELPSEVRKDWDEAGHREFYAGYHVGDELSNFAEYFDPETLRAASDVNAGIGFTLYHAPLTNEEGMPEELL